MPLTPNFSFSQSLSSTNEITITDTSTGDDAGIAARRVYVRLADGTFLVEDGVTDDYNPWALADTSVTLDLLTRSIAPAIQVDWLDEDGVALYSKTLTALFAADDELFAYELLQDVAADSSILSDKPYFDSLMAFQVNLDQAQRAIDLANDTSAAQNSLDRNYNMILNQTFAF